MSTLSAIGSMMGAAAAAEVPLDMPEELRRQSIGTIELRRLVSRMTFGYTAEEFELAKSLGLWGYIWYHLNHEQIDDSAVEAELNGPAYETLRWTPEQCWNYAVANMFDNSRIIYELVSATTMRAIRSKRQLHERMVEFWNDHFNIYIYSDYADMLKTTDDRSVARTESLSTFREILRRSATSAAMMIYLNNNVNYKDHPNENYARELLELHTMGVNGGYTQRDVQEVARVFTGWTVHYPGTGVKTLTFKFDPFSHDNGSKVIFKDTPQELFIAPGGRFEGEKLLDAMSRHPSTARFISTKLLKKFWGENPPQWAIDWVSSVYLQTDTDLKQTMTAVLACTTSWQTPRKYKRPFHLMVSGIRAVDGDVSLYHYLANYLYGAGHYPFLWPPPNGYPDTIGYWSPLQLPRWSMFASLLNDELPSTRISVGTLIEGCRGAEAVMRRLEERLFAMGIGPKDREVLKGYLGPASAVTPPLRVIKEVVGLALSSPSFSWY
jgi:Protein of unknown function (DUF1800)